MKLLVPIVAALILSSCVSAPPEDGRCYSCEGLVQAGQMMQQGAQRRYSREPIRCQTWSYGNGNSTTTCQ